MSSISFACSRSAAFSQVSPQWAQQVGSSVSSAKWPRLPNNYFYEGDNVLTALEAPNTLVFECVLALDAVISFPKCVGSGFIAFVYADQGLSFGVTPVNVINSAGTVSESRALEIDSLTSGS